MKCPNPELPLEKKRYTTTELNAHNEQLKPCGLCSKTKRNKCKKKRLKIKGTESSPIPMKKSIKADKGEKRERFPQIKGQMIARRAGFISIKTGKIIQGRQQIKIIPITYYRTSPPHKITFVK